MDQKMIKTLGAIIAGFAVFIIILFFVSSCTNRKYTYDKLEEKMLKIAKSYYEANKKELPQQDKDTKSLTLKKMISDGKIEELSELFDDENIKCDGNVTVTNNNGYYLYSPYLSCGDDYETKYLSDKIIDDSLVESGVGLYANGDSYVMKGEVLNNYVQMGEKLFRIIGINEDGTIRLFEMSGLQQIVWDDRFNPDNNYNSGLNEYYFNDINSRIKQSLEEYYKSDVWTDEMKSYLSTFDLCVGKRSSADITKDGSAECSQKLEGQVLGLLSTHEYLQASLDSNCVATLDKACRNYNWFGGLDLGVWTITADAETSRSVYIMYKSLALNTASGFAYANVVVNLSDKAIYVSGDGTEKNPYIFR